MPAAGLGCGGAVEGGEMQGRKVLTGKEEDKGTERGAGKQGSAR